MPYRHYPYMTSRHQPFEVMLFVAAVSAGISFFSGSPPKSLEQFMPDWYLKFWYISVLLGGLIGVGTVFLKRGTRRQLDLVLKLERGALLIIAGAIFSYVCALISSVRPLGGAIVASILVGGWMMAAIVRIIQIHISLRRLKEVDNSDEGVT